MQIQGLDGKTALATAAGQNVGRRVALAFAEAGPNVVINGLSDLGKIEGVAEEAERFGVKALPILADCSQWSSVATMVEGAVKAYGSLDVAVSTVGIPSASGIPRDFGRGLGQRRKNESQFSLLRGPGRPA